MKEKVLGTVFSALMLVMFITLGLAIRGQMLCVDNGWRGGLLTFDGAYCTRLENATDVIKPLSEILE